MKPPFIQIPPRLENKNGVAVATPFRSNCCTAGSSVLEVELDRNLDNAPALFLSRDAEIRV